jgi:hypothetical protein
MVEARPKRRLDPRLSLTLRVFALAVLGLLVAAAMASADEPYGAPIESLKIERSTNQAGGHPDLRIEFVVGTRATPVIPNSCFCNTIKDLRFEFPAGFIGNTHAVPQCSVAQLTASACPIDSQIGISDQTVALGGDGGGPGTLYSIRRPVYNLIPNPGQPGLIGFLVAIQSSPVYTVLSARTGGDYGLNAESRGILTSTPLRSFTQTLWGVPASPANDAERANPGYPGFESFGFPSSSPETPYLSNPTSCTGPSTARFTTYASDHGVHSAEVGWAPTTGCDQLNFNPSQSANPTTESADSASGMDIVLKVPQSSSPNTPSDSQIKAATVRFPAGFSINPNAADGKTTCSDEQARFGSSEEAQCPEHAKVGTVSLESNALPSAIPGAIYLADPLPGDRYRVIVVADGYATHIKFAGTTKTDPVTGQVTAIFPKLPQAPLTEFSMHFFGSERGLFATPERCGTYPVESEFVPWAGGPNQTSTQFFRITSGPGGGPCPADVRNFAPGFRAAGASNGAGAHSPLSIYITRQDGDQTLSSIGVNTPPGVTATLKGVPKCPDAAVQEIEDPSWSGHAEQAGSKCPIGSQVGVSEAGAGAGSRPYYTPGKVYLTGPYRGAPLSFTVVTPAVSGPYDLGNIVNRVALSVDPTTTAVTAVSDPLPQTVGGIPLRLRSVLINLDRKDFTLNPTNCSPFTITGLITGIQGGSAMPQNFFQVGNCDSLDFEPKLKAVVRGPVRRGGHPALTTTITHDTGSAANIGKAVVTLPHSAFLDQSHIRTICTRTQFAAEACPPGSVYGKAKAVTPLLDEPLEGPVYLRSSSNTLPDLVADLRGPASLPIQVVLVGRIDSPDQQIRATFSSVPDTPVSRFTLQMQGGRKGLLINSTNVCRGGQRVNAKFTGQNGTTVTRKPRLENPQCGKAAAKRKRAAARHGRRSGR